MLLRELRWGPEQPRFSPWPCLLGSAARCSPRCERERLLPPSLPLSLPTTSPEPSATHVHAWLGTTQVFLEPRTLLHLIKPLPPPGLRQENRHDCELGEPVCSPGCAGCWRDGVPWYLWRESRFCSPGPVTIDKAPARVFSGSVLLSLQGGSLYRAAWPLFWWGLGNKCICHHACVCWVGRGMRNKGSRF